MLRRTLNYQKTFAQLPWPPALARCSPVCWNSDGWTTWEGTAISIRLCKRPLWIVYRLHWTPPQTSLHAGWGTQEAEVFKLCVAWLDLANAFGSVHHHLIRYSFSHYHATYIGDGGDDLQLVRGPGIGVISSKSWQTAPIFTYRSVSSKVIRCLCWCLTPSWTL